MMGGNLIWGPYSKPTFDPPVYICVRDRVTHLRALVSWLERAGHERIVFVDNASTYEPCVEYLKATPHDVVCLGRNAGSRALWSIGTPDEWFVWTDPDVIPTEVCPLDAVARLRELLCRHTQYRKAGLGLHLDDVPPTLQCLAWESGPTIRGHALEGGGYRSLIDTTFALYRPGAGFDYTAIRASAPYEARHMPWYTVGQELSVEDAYYLSHARGGEEGSSWLDGRQV